MLALRAAASSPPAIAEFAPQAQQIRQAPQEQTAAFGTARGGAAGTASPSPSPQPPVPASGATIPLMCVGDPPRQIDDPQSPPCVTGWQGDNGGATGKGVTKSSITIVYIRQSGNADQITPMLAPALRRFFNQRFELYNRQITFAQEDESGTMSSQEQSQADQIAAADSPFASLRWSDEGGLQYEEELARKGVVASLGFQSYPAEAQLAQYDPYLWSYEMAGDGMLRMLGRWYCAELAGKPAAHAGPLIRDQPRKLAVVYRPFDADENMPLDVLQDTLRTCGVQVTPVVVRAANDTPDPTLIAQFQQEHDTSIMCICEGFYYQDLSSAATSQGYFPEWLLSVYSDDTNFAFHFGDGPDPQQAPHAFGLTFQPRQVKLADSPFWWAWRAGDPSATPPSTYLYIFGAETFYESLLEIASGIQMAGPDLTPQNFAAGLHRAVFPNPETPIHAGHVGFANGSHSMTIDAAEWWYDPSAPSPYAAQGDQQGSVCYVEHGRRHELADWPDAPDPFFEGPCDSGA
jgi:hypothetical protein